MARLIDAEKLVANFRATKIDEVFPNWKELFPSTQATIIRLTAKYRAIVLSAPAVDAVEVVRCFNCQKHEPCEVRNRVWCRQMGRYMKEDGFCSEGVKMDAGG